MQSRLQSGEILAILRRYDETNHEQITAELAQKTGLFNLNDFLMDPSIEFKNATEEDLTKLEQFIFAANKIERYDPAVGLFLDAYYQRLKQRFPSHVSPENRHYADYAKIKREKPLSDECKIAKDGLKEEIKRLMKDYNFDQETLDTFSAGGNDQVLIMGVREESKLIIAPMKKIAMDRCRLLQQEIKAIDGDPSRAPEILLKDLKILRNRMKSTGNKSWLGSVFFRNRAFFGFLGYFGGITGYTNINKIIDDIKKKIKNKEAAQQPVEKKSWWQLFFRGNKKSERSAQVNQPKKGQKG